MTALLVLAAGALVADPQRREGKKGPFTTAQIRAGAGGDAVLVSVVAFGDEAARLLEYAKGDALAVSGPARLTSWQSRDGAERHGLSLVAEQIASAKPRLKAQSARNGAARSSAPHNADAHPRRVAQPADDGREFDDEIPF